MNKFNCKETPSVQSRGKLFVVGFKGNEEIISILGLIFQVTIKLLPVTINPLTHQTVSNTSKMP